MPTSYSSVEAIPRTSKKVKRKTKAREGEELCPICGKIVYLSLDVATPLFEIDEQGEVSYVNEDAALSDLNCCPGDYECVSGHTSYDIKAFCRMRATTAEYCRKAAKAGYPSHKDQAIFEVKVVNGPEVRYCDLYSPVYVISPPDGGVAENVVEEAAHGFLGFVRQSEKLFGWVNEFSLDQRLIDLYLSPAIKDRRGNVFWISNINPEAAFRTFEMLWRYFGSVLASNTPVPRYIDPQELLTDAVTPSTPPVSIPHEKPSEGPENGSGDATPTTQYGF